MPRRTTQAVMLSLGVITAIGAGTIALLQVKHYLAYRRMGDISWYRTASPLEQRETAHEALAFWFGDPHDAFGILERFGDASSVPHLRAALASQPPYAPHGGVECTWNHARNALERIERSEPATNAGD